MAIGPRGMGGGGSIASRSSWNLHMPEAVAVAVRHKVGDAQGGVSTVGTILLVRDNKPARASELVDVSDGVV